MNKVDGLILSKFFYATLKTLHLQPTKILQPENEK